jgi:hypothetical protein
LIKEDDAYKKTGAVVAGYALKNGQIGEIEWKFIS